MARQLIVVDVETSGLTDPFPLEIAAVNIDTGDEFRMIPHVTQAQLAKAEPEALQINRYYERGVFRDMLDNVEMTKSAYGWLADMLRGNTFGGSNPAFDSAIIRKHGYLTGDIWHHRLADLSAYAAGKFDVDPTELEGLDAVCERLGVNVDERHSAMGDARATAECFALLRTIKAAHL